MQRTEDGGIVISCDFCGTDWDEVKPMIEGHHGSVLCLACLQTALEQAGSELECGDTAVQGQPPCTMCLQELEQSTARWVPTTRPAGANPLALICTDCINQAAGTFSKDPDIDWKRPR